MQNNEKDSKDRVTRLEERSAWRNLLVGFIIGITGLLGYAVSVPGGFHLLFLGLLLSVATFVSGSFIGTLFGMPKRNNANDASNTYTLNNSLVEISDWLTKIIVGLGLVNLKQLPSQLMSIGDFVNRATGGKGFGVNVFVNSLVVYFGVLGLYIGYNYMRLVLSQKYKTADDSMVSKAEFEEVKEVAVQKERENQELKNTVQETVAQTNSVVSDLNKANSNTDFLHLFETGSVPLKVVNDEKLSIKNSVADLISTARTRTLQGKVANSVDPQKGQWGGKSTNNNRLLTATVQELVGDLFSINLKVVSTDPVNNPLPDNEVVLFALHDTFGDPPIRLVKSLLGSAELKLFSYGSFTVGVCTDNGDTELELDLAQLPGVSEYFKTH